MRVITDALVVQPVALADLARVVDGRLVGDAAGVVVDDLTYDSRRVHPGTLFVCVPGSTTDGHDHAPDAVTAGAVALVCERSLGLGVPELVVTDCRAAMAPLAAHLYDHPADAMRVVGITGTNGKTTVAHLVAAIFESAGSPAVAIGSLTGLHTTPTTPEAPDLHRHLAALRSAGTEVVALEVSSHALELHRVDAMVVDVAVFTNLSRDHLDFHGTMNAYFQAKAKLFTPERARRAVVNLDDPHGRLLSDASQIPTVGYRMADADDLVLSGDSSSFRWRGQRVSLPLAGSVNVANALAAATAAAELGLDPATIAAGLARVTPVSGRFEWVDLDAPFSVMVDYAHTPDALEQLLLVARELGGDGRVRVVFGCGGDKDTGKRAPMGEIAARLADHVVITSDNPRTEAPEDIIAAIRQGVGRVDGVTVEEVPDRRRAIAQALGAASEGDLVVIAGFGHETVQTIGTERVPFDDRLVAREEYAALRGTAGGGVE
jgi:UDP-N-acetylmuramoyl-L-alanyl-D-glutamate--2,6-diaminopimelate ligase